MRLAVLLLASSLAASAQNASGGDGTSAQNRGSTGWTVRIQKPAEQLSIRPSLTANLASPPTRRLARAWPFTMTPWQRISLRSRQARTLTARRAALRQAKHRNNQPLPAIRTCLGRFQCRPAGAIVLQKASKGSECPRVGPFLRPPGATRRDRTDFLRFDFWRTTWRHSRDCKLSWLPRPLPHSAAQHCWRRWPETL